MQFVMLMCLSMVCLTSAHGRHGHVLPTFTRRTDVTGKLLNAREQYDARPTPALSTVIRPVNVAASLTVKPAVVTLGQTITISWTDVPFPRKNCVSTGPGAHNCDWIAMYCPTNSSAHGFLEYWWVDQSATYNDGYGSIETPIHYNPRADCVFKYYGNNTFTELVAVSNTLKVSVPPGPKYLHLAVTENESEMRVMWQTELAHASIARFGTDPNHLNTQVTGQPHTYDASNLCQAPANESGYIAPGYLHDLVLSGLQPDTEYFYSVNDGDLFSPVKSFHSAPRAHAESAFKFITYMDMGLGIDPGASDTATLVSREVDNGARLVYHMGDLSYAVGFAYIWDPWFSLIEPYSSRVPYIVSIGNHEYCHLGGGDSQTDPSCLRGQPCAPAGWHPSWGNMGSDSGGECGRPTYERFHMPASPNSNSVFWYAYTYGSVRFVVASMEHDFLRGSVQYTWLESELRTIDRKVTPWVIFGAHRPMYASENYASDYKVSLYIRQELEPLFRQYKVDLFLSGHYHSYERTCPVYNDTCCAEGESCTIHLMVGSAGASLDDAPLLGKPWSKHFEDEFGYGRITVHNSSALTFEFIRNRDNIVTDSVLVKHFV